MKTQNLILGICAFTLAIGTAFASVLLPIAERVSVNYGKVPNEPTCSSRTVETICRNIEFDCENSTSGSTCKAKVTDLTTNTSYTGNMRNSSCATITSTTNSNTVVYSDACILSVN